MSASNKQRNPRTLKSAVLKALAAAKIAQVRIDYDGEGDSGQTGNIAACDTHGILLAGILAAPSTIRPAPGVEPFPSLYEAVDALAWELLDIHHGGFVNDDGGFGTITIDVLKKSIRLDHNDRVMESVNTTTEV